MEKNKTKIGIELLISIVLLSSFASAFAVSYGLGTSLEMYPGESRELYFSLQNKAGDLGDINVAAELAEGQEIATLTDGLETYFIPYGKDIRVNFTIKIPEDAEFNKTHIIKFYATTIPDKESGGMGFAQGIGQKIEVTVVPEPSEEPIAEVAEENPQLGWILAFVGLAIIIIAIVLIIVIKKKMRK